MKTSVLNKFLLFLLLFFSAAFVSCSNNSVDKVELDSGWKYSLENPNTEEVSLQYLPDAELENLQNFIPGKSGTIYLTKTFMLPQSLQKKDIACYFGRISYSDRVYLNHYLVGSTGFDEKKKYSSGYEPRFYDIPEELLLPGINTITVEIFVQNRGYFRSNAFLSLHNTAKLAWVADRFWNSQIYLVFACILLFLGFYSLKTFVKINSKRDVLFYSLMCFISVFALSLFYVNELPFFNFYKLNYNIFYKVTGFVLPAVIFFLFTLFVDSFFERTVKTNIIIIRAAVLIVPQLVYLCIPMRLSIGFISWIPYFGFIPGIIQVIFVLYLQLNSSKRNSVKLTLCVSLVPLFLLFDLFFHNGMSLNYLPYLTNAGWPMCMFATMFLISTKKITELKEELSTAIVPVNKIYSQPEPEIVIMPSQPALPEHQTFDLNKAPVFDNFEIAFCHKPSGTLSSNMFEFFTDSNILKGLAFCEASGSDSSLEQFISLAKNSVSVNFTDGNLLPLTKVMQNINTGIINEKGDCDNSLSAILIRLLDTRIEYVNVGHAPAFYRNEKGSKCMAIQINSDIYAQQAQGTVGTEEITSDYKGIGFAFNHGDSIIIYSDSFMNASNVHGEPFGQDRICQAFLQSPAESAEAKLSYIINMFQNYTHDVPVKKDLTVIIVQKK